MKLSLAFVALTAAADSQAPVISLNLFTTGDSAGVHSSYGLRHTKQAAFKDGLTGNDETMPHHQVTTDGTSAGPQNSFADECEVARYGTDAVHCQEPVASAYDHHDGDISASISTVYRLFVDAPQRKSPRKTEYTEGDLNLKQRGEWVITYDVKDDAGNEAEQVQFALIMIDTVDPEWTNSPMWRTVTPNAAADDGKFGRVATKANKCTKFADCTGTTATNYLTKTAAQQVEVELCGATASTGYHIIQDQSQLTAHDNYDGLLTQSNAKVSFKIDNTDFVASTYKLGDTATTSLNDYADFAFTERTDQGYEKYNSAKTYTYDLYAADFADIFGHNNNNNAIEEKGTVTLKDTILPTIDNVGNTADTTTYALSWECGYQAHNYRAGTKSAQYSDCYDDINTEANNMATVVKISCPDQPEFEPIDQISDHIGEGSTFASPWVMEPTPAHNRCLAVGGHGYGFNAAGTTGSYTGGRANTNINSQSASTSTVTLQYSLRDKFGNPAVNNNFNRTIQITDSIAPTLYITRAQIRTANDFNNHSYTTGIAAGGDDKCLHHDNTGKTNTGDYTTEYCVQTHSGGHNTYQHIDAANPETAGSTFAADDANKALCAADDNDTNGCVHVDNNNAYASEMTIQHSAGYARDYQYVQELMEEGNGFGCYDQCSSTTTIVSWRDSTCNAESTSEFNMLQPGTYYLKYECKDQSNNIASACRTFINVDKTRPVITVLQAANQEDSAWHVEASRDNNYVDAGATCSDMVDGNISQDVEVSGDVVNMAAVGTYRINYNCEDSAGQTAVPATRTVIVEDKTCPTCTIPGGPENQIVTVEASFPYTEEQSTCTDTLDGAMPNAHVVGTVDVELTGSYVLTYTVTDKNGNGGNKTCHAAPHSNTVNTPPTANAAHFMKTVVVEDTMIPIISLKYRGTDLVGMMAESSTTTVNGWVIGAIASAVSGVALLGYAATRKATVATSVPV